MSRPIYVGANISTTHTFSQWLNKSNQIIFDMGTVVMTTTPFPQPNTINGGVTVGNAHIEGIFSANTIVAKDGLRGGTVSTPANMVVFSNTIFAQSALVHIQPNTNNFTVNANNSTFTGSFTMSNTAKPFAITANSTTIAHGPFVVTSNTTISGANAHIFGTNFTITSNTVLTATSTTLNSNVQVNGINTNVNSNVINLGATNAQTLYINSKLGQTITPSNTSVNLGSLTANFGNAHLTEIFANSAYLDGYIEIEGNGRQVISTKALDANNTSSLMISFRNNANAEVNAYYLDQASLFPKANSTVSLGSTTNRFGAFFTNVATITTDVFAGNSANITSQANAATVRARNLVGGRVTFANTTNFIVDSANFTYNGTTLTINSAATATGIAVQGGGTFGGTLDVVGNTTIDDNFTVNGNNAQFAGMSNTLNATIRTVNNQNIMYSSNGLVVGTNNLIYNNTELRITTPTTTTVAINTNGSMDVSGYGIFGANVSVGNILNVTSYSNSASVRARNLTNTRVPFANSANYLVDSANFTYNGTALTITTANTATGLIVAGAATFGGSIAASGNGAIGDNLTVAGNTATFAGLVNTNSLNVRNFLDKAVPYSSNGYFKSNTNFVYDEVASRLTINGSVATAVAINTSGSIDATGSGIFGANVNVGNILNVTNQANSATVRARNLVGGRVTFANTTNFLVDSANFTYNGTTLTVNAGANNLGLAVTGGATFGNTANVAGDGNFTGSGSFGNNLIVSGAIFHASGMANVSSLTVRDIPNNHIMYSSNGLMITTPNFTYNGSILTINGVATSAVAINTSGSVDASGFGTFGTNLTAGGFLNLGGVANVASVRARNLTGTRIPFANTTNFLVDSANFTYNGTTLTITTANTATGLSLGGGAYVGGALEVIDSTTLRNGLTVYGAVATSTSLSVGSQANANTLRVRSMNANHILYSSDDNGIIAGNSNFTFNGSTLSVTAGNSTTTSISTVGSINSGGNGVFASDLTVGGSQTIAGDLVVVGSTTLSSNSQLALNTSTINYLTVSSELTFGAVARTIGSIIPKTTNINDLGSSALTYRTVYANNFIGNLAWSNLTSVPSPVLTFTGDTTGTGTMTNLGSVSVTLTTRNANSTVSGLVNTAAQTFTGAKTFTNGVVGALTGNATTATTLQTARTINGTSFNGSANITTPVRVRRATESSNTTVPLMILHNATYDDTADMAINDVGISNRLNYNILNGVLTSVEFNSSSDSRWKTNVKTIDKALDKVKNMRGVEYDRIDTPGHYVGVIAQEMEKVIPEAVHTDDDGYKYVSYGNLVGVLIESIKELTAKVEHLEKELKDKE